MTPPQKSKGAVPDSKAEPESFSPASAKLAAEGLIQALPKTRRAEYLGNLNEILVVINRLTQEAGITNDRRGL